MYQIFTENIQEGDEYPYERKSLKLTKLPFTLSHEKQSNRSVISVKFSMEIVLKIKSGALKWQQTLDRPHICSHNKIECSTKMKTPREGRVICQSIFFCTHLKAF